MKTYKNKHFTKIFGDCTTIAYCQSENDPGSDWVECSDMQLARSGAKLLYTQAGAKIYGWL